ncbi:hypothetical protein HWV62_4191, partial [Athelia sp. TMB]
VVVGAVKLLAAMPYPSSASSGCLLEWPRVWKDKKMDKDDPQHIGCALCCNEAFKIATSSAAYLNNYFMPIGTDGVYSYTFEYEQRVECPVCGGKFIDVVVAGDFHGVQPAQDKKPEEGRGDAACAGRCCV